MKKINLTIGALLLGSVLFASNFVACGGGDSNATGSAGTTGASGTTGSAGTGTDGGAGTGVANTDGGNATLADGRCATGAYAPKDGGVCACQLSIPNVCGDICTDLKTDNDNCGTCGHKCAATSACSKGACGPEAAIVVPKIAGCGELTLAASGEKVYYADQMHGTISSVASTGGTITPLAGAQAEKAPTAIAVSGTNILWINNVTGAAVDGGLPSVESTLRKSVAGAAPVDLVKATAPGGGIRGFVVSTDGATVYYSTGTFVKSIPFAGAATSTDIAVEEHGGIPAALALEGTKLVYPTDLNGDVDVITIVPGMTARCGKEDATKPSGFDALNCVRIARSQGSLKKQVVFAFGGWAYWIDSPSVKSGELAPPGTPANDQVGDTQNAIQGMGTNKTNIYFSDTDTSMPATAPSGTIWKTGINKAQKDATQVPIARGQVSPSAVSVGATKVFWTADCAINSTAL